MLCVCVAIHSVFKSVSFRDLKYKARTSTKPTLLHAILCDFGTCDKKILLAFVLFLKTWILLNWPSSSQNVSSLIGPFFLKGSQVTGVQATHWYQCGGCKEL